MEPRYNEDCSICLEPLYFMEAGENLLSTPCRHLFHRQCLWKWFESGEPGNCCPLCKRLMLRAEPKPVTLEQFKSVARRSARIATMISTTNHSTVAASSNPTPSSSSRSRAPVTDPTPVSENSSGLSSRVEAFKRDVQRIYESEGSFHAFQVLFESVDRRMQNWQQAGVPAVERLEGILVHLQELEQHFPRLERDHGELARRAEDLKQEHDNMMAHVQTSSQEEKALLEQHIGLLKSSNELHSRYSEMHRKNMEILRNVREIMEEYERRLDS